MNNNYFDKIFEDEIKKINIENIDEAGIVISSYDGLVLVRGLSTAFINEIVIFDSGTKGIIVNISNDKCSIFVFEKIFPFCGEGVRRTKIPFGLKISKKFLGRVLDVFGNFVDGFLSEENTDEVVTAVEADVIGIVGRKPVAEPLLTGIISIDSVIPIGKGQRQLFVGSRGTGKTSTLIDIIVNQKKNNVLCVYVAIAQKQASVVSLRNYLEKNDCLDNCIIVCADAGEPTIEHYLSPYVGITIAEYFSKNENRDVLIVYDDLSNHAIAYREISLLMKNLPTREAYPSDIFYSHARLLERAGCYLKYGSITALPVVQLQEDDITAYIPTNLISITDGQVFFDTKLFNNGIFPAINTELSVSRVGGAAQSKLIKNLSRSLRLDLAQYHELSVFSQFGGDLDFQTKEKIENGKILIELLTQPLERRYSMADQIIILNLLRFFIKDLRKISDIKNYVFWMLDFISKIHENFYLKLNSGSEFNSDDEIKLKEIITDTLLILKKNDDF